MATRLYFRNAVNAAPGTYPAGEQSALTADYTAAGGSTLKRLAKNPNLAGNMTSHAGTSLASLVPQSGLYGMFLSSRFSEDQTIGNQVLTVNIAMQESDANMNMGAGLTANVYVWRPSTGAVVGVICANVALTGAAEPSAGSIRVVQGTVATTTPVNALFADVIICEIWQTHTQGAATAFTGGFYYDGSTVTTVNDTLVTDHASFINFSFDNLQITTDFADGSLDVTLGAVTLTADGTVTTPPPAPVVATPSSGGSGAGYKSRKKFRVPEDEEVESIEEILAPEVPDKPEAVVEPAKPVKTDKVSLAQAVAQHTVPIAKTVVVKSIKVKTAPKIVSVDDEEEYSDEELIRLLLLFTP